MLNKWEDDYALRAGKDFKGSCCSILYDLHCNFSGSSKIIKNVHQSTQ
jgi:hypothetical protein